MNKAKSVFPIIDPGQNSGLTIRQYYAAMAMQGMMNQFVKGGYPENNQIQELQWMVNASFIVADAMIEAENE